MTWRVAYILPLLFVASSALSQHARQRDDWNRYFSDAGVDGAIDVYDARVDSQWVYNAARVRERFSPASTFKVPHALFALDAKVVRDEFQRFAWDGISRNNEAWDRDQTMRSSMRHSVVWLYQRWARAIGGKAESRKLGVSPRFTRASTPSVSTRPPRSRPRCARPDRWRWGGHAQV